MDPDASSANRPPSAKQVAREFVAHGDRRVDEYYWLRERDNPEVIAYLEAENAYTAAVMAPARELRERIYTEILGRIQQTDLDVPARRDGYFYYTRTVEGLQYPIYCRKRASLEAAEEILLNANELAEGKPYFSLGAFAVSEDHQYLAYSEDFNGAEEYTVRVKNLGDGRLLVDEIPLTSHGLVWANDNRTFFYTTFDAAKRPEKVWRHGLGTDRSQDQVVFSEPDLLFTFELGKTRSNRFLVITSVNASTTSEVWTLDADNPSGPFVLFDPRRAGVEYYVDHQGERWLVRTNENGATNFRLDQAPLASTDRSQWRNLIPERPGITLDGVDPFENHLVIYTRERGLPCIHVRDTRSGETHIIEFPEAAYTVAPGANLEYGSDRYRYVYTSQLTPLSVYDYNMDTRQAELKKRTAVLGAYEPGNYASERIYAQAEDGRQVPISLVHRRGVSRDGLAPLLLHGYGSYGINSDPVFSYSSLSLLDRGFVVAIAHVRGGSEYGRAWFEDGRMLRKRNSFTDFIACAEHLVNLGYTSPDRLGAMGGSAGGLLMGAVINLRPDLFRSVVAQVPFVDVITTMSDPTIPLTTGEYDQWGNPEAAPYYWYMKSYSPYDNVEAKAYPNLLVTTGLNDPRVAYWEPAKWVARLRERSTNQNLILLQTQMGAGHGGPSGRYEKYRETALAYAFLLTTLEGVLTSEGRSRSD